MQTWGVAKDDTNYLGLLFTVKLQAHYIRPEKKKMWNFKSQKFLFSIELSW